MMRVIAIGAHPDDVEIGMGGTLAKHIEKGDDVHIIVCTLGGVSGAPQQREQEAQRAASILGINQVTILNYPVSRLNKKPHAEFVNKIRQIIANLKPFRVYTHTEYDYHQVHVAVNTAVSYAVKKENVEQLLFFETISSTTPEFGPNAFVDITDYINLKIKSVQEHKSQSHRPYLQPNVIRSLANTRYVWGKVGSDANGLAEAFTVYKYNF
jgi:LmbE family N-acetylglucosaminyl deacetylase